MPQEQQTSIGFFKDAEELRAYLQGNYFGFLETEQLFEDITARDFLHGYCEYFACYLWDKYGWEIKKAYANGKLVHAFCVANQWLIDIRGGTKKPEEFWEEFRTHLFSLTDSKNYNELDIQSVSTKWAEQTLNKKDSASIALFEAAKHIDEKYNFWQAIVQKRSSR